jgi:hypothetical protein
MLPDKIRRKNSEMNIQPACNCSPNPFGVRLNSNDGSGLLTANYVGDNPRSTTYIEDSGIRRDKFGQLHSGVIGI